MNEKWFSAAGALARAPAEAPADRGPAPARLGGGTPLSPPRRFTLIRILSATFVVAAIQIMICMDGGIDFGIAAQPILATHAARAAGSPGARGPTTQRPPNRSLRITAFIPVADRGNATGDAVESVLSNCAASAAGGLATRTDCAATARAAGPVPADPGPSATAGKIEMPTAGPAPPDGLGDKDRSTIILGLILLGGGDPRLRFVR